METLQIFFAFFPGTARQGRCAVFAVKKFLQCSQIRIKNSEAFQPPSFVLLDLEHLGQLHRQVQVACQFDLSLHEGLHPVQFAGEDLDVIGRICG